MLKIFKNPKKAEVVTNNSNTNGSSSEYLNSLDNNIKKIPLSKERVWNIDNIKILDDDGNEILMKPANNLKWLGNQRNIDLNTNMNEIKDIEKKLLDIKAQKGSLSELNILENRNFSEEVSKIIEEENLLLDSVKKLVEEEKEIIDQAYELSKDFEVSLELTYFDVFTIALIAASTCYCSWYVGRTILYRDNLLWTIVSGTYKFIFPPKTSFIDNIRNKVSYYWSLFSMYINGDKWTKREMRNKSAEKIKNKLKRYLKRQTDSNYNSFFK